MLSSAFIGAFGVIDQADARICRDIRTGKPIYCITRPYMHDISAFNPTIQGNKRKTAIATIELKKTSRGWKPTSKTGKWTRTWSDDYLARFNPTINGNRATVKVKLKQTKKGWIPVEPIQ
jgi:hypothetical protein